MQGSHNSFALSHLIVGLMITLACIIDKYSIYEYGDLYNQKKTRPPWGTGFDLQ